MQFYKMAETFHDRHYDNPAQDVYIAIKWTTKLNNLNYPSKKNISSIYGVQVKILTIHNVLK
jgi:hypothetical protein